jgi:hypothetical protein
MKQKKTAIFKFNNGDGALLCSKCKVIIKTLKEMDDVEKLAFHGDFILSAQYCTNCKK